MLNYTVFPRRPFPVARVDSFLGDTRFGGIRALFSVRFRKGTYALVRNSLGGGGRGKDGV